MGQIAPQTLWLCGRAGDGREVNSDSLANFGWETPIENFPSVIGSRDRILVSFEEFLPASLAPLELLAYSVNFDILEIPGGTHRWVFSQDG
jgi:hypothetical protein